jgi:hypothetical protein
MRYRDRDFHRFLVMSLLLFALFCCSLVGLFATTQTGPVVITKTPTALPATPHPTGVVEPTPPPVTPPNAPDSPPKRRHEAPGAPTYTVVYVVSGAGRSVTLHVTPVHRPVSVVKHCQQHHKARHKRHHRHHGFHHHHKNHCKRH